MSTQPFVSVVIPVYNGADTIEELLLSLLAQNYPGDRYEIIVVDNGSRDNTCEIVGKYLVTLLKEWEKRGAAAARNKGIREAQGDIIAFIDADCVADRNWLRIVVADHQDSSIGAFVGEVRGHEPARTKVEVILNQQRRLSPFRFEESAGGKPQAVLKSRIPIQPRTVLERLWVRLGIITYYQQRMILPQLYSAPTANVAYRRAALEAVGLFDDDLVHGEDPDLAYRVQLNTNYRFHPAPEAVVYHKHQTTLAEVFLHQQGYGLARMLLLDKYIGLCPNVRRQAILEACLNIVFGFPYMFVEVVYPGLRALVKGQPYSTYLYEPLVRWASDLGNNYGRIKACLAGVQVSKQGPPLLQESGNSISECKYLEDFQS
jgi:glycosyltransferase involved in cell wall biosynthesis